jgi:hypothetical protein
VNILPQRVNPGTISGSTVTYGSIGNLLTGLTFDDGTEAKLDDLKFKAVSKNIKIDSKKGELSIKKVDGDPAEVEISNKKNKNAKASFKFDITPLNISSGAINIDLTKALAKNYKNLTAFKEKFIGKNLADETMAKASGMEAKIPKLYGKENVKLKAGGKDLIVSVTWGGVKQKGDAYVDTASGSVVKDVEFTIKGTGNYTGSAVVTEAVPLEHQTVDVVTGWSLTYNAIPTTANVFKFIKLDKSESSVGDISDSTKKTDTIKALKITGTKELKIDSNGNFKLKSVPSDGKATVKIEVKKNNKSDDAKNEIEIKIKKCSKTDGAFIFDDSKYKDKDQTSVDKAKKAIEKTVLKFTPKGSKSITTLKKGKDYKEIKIETANITTATSIVDVSAELEGNYTGTVTGQVNINFK